MGTEQQMEAAIEAAFRPEDRVPTIHERMIAILADLPAIGKTQRNTQQNFMYRGHDDVLNALNPLLAEHGVFVVPDVVERIEGRREVSGGRVMFEVNLHVEFTFWGAGGDFVQASGWGEGTDMGDKSTNKAMTAAFKYVIAQAFAISTAENQDADGQTPEETIVRDLQRMADPLQLPEGWKAAGSWEELRERFAELGVPSHDLAEWLKQSAALDLPEPLSGFGNFQRANRMLAALTGHTGDVQFDPEPRADLRKLFAQALAGEVLDGPAWRIGPTEDDRPAHESEPETYAEEDIEFEAAPGADNASV